MLKNISEIKNPVARSVTTAGVAFSAVTIISSLVIGVVNPKGQSAHKFGVYASLIGTGCGILVGLVACSKITEAESLQNSSEGQESNPGSHIWQDWRKFVVVRKVRESKEIISFYLKPEDNGDLPNFQPGQFLTIKLDIPGEAKPVIRTYSLSDYSDSNEYYRLSIKREPMPKGLDVMPGIASNFMHDRVQEGSVILAKPPSGKFVLDVHHSLPAVLISNGVGITPMLSMAKACSHLNPNRPLWFLHGARDGRFHAFRDEVTAIAQQNPNIHVHFRYSRPLPEDAGHYHSVGYIDVALIKELVGQEAEFFLCGSPPFMQSIREGLQEWGIPEGQVFFESFSKGGKAASESQPPATAIGEETKEAEIVFAKSNKTLTWREGDGTILEFAEANNLNPAYSCRMGICLTCMCGLKAGEVVYEEPPTGTPDEGSVLICISKPKAPKVILDL
ncbi:MAG: 2Fe-2S iron-sulfur cluster binding domain-containing protein [Chroococcidiopsidaceae cyanobacterium CP_BM_ER_R8_30]|nr:2Fe-2S iron-sulfur cluster binding domain-containing protein [Chroococcidiopsidaceae cyanobacterium CP_BM_ER_R8_30]